MGEFTYVFTVQEFFRKGLSSFGLSSDPKDVEYKGNKEITKKIMVNLYEKFFCKKKQNNRKTIQREGDLGIFFWDTDKTKKQKKYQHGR